MADTVETPVTPTEAAPEAAEETPVETQEVAPEADGSKAAAVEDAKETLADPKATKAEKKQAQKTLKKIKLKVDGEEFEEELPFDIPDTPEAVEYARKQLQLAKMSHKRAQEKSNIEKDVMEFINLLKTNPKKALSDPSIGLDIKKFAASIIEEEIENAKKSPEQLEKEKLESELRAMKEEREKEKKEAKEREDKQLQEKYHMEFEQQITTAFDANKIPKSPISLNIISDYLAASIQLGKEVTINDLIPLVREELSQGFQNHLSALPDDELENYIGKPIVDKLRKRAVAKVKQANSNPALKAPTKVPNTGKTSQEEKAAEKMTFKQFFKV